MYLANIYRSAGTYDLLEGIVEQVNLVKKLYIEIRLAH